MRVPVPPFLTAPPDLILHGPWLFRDEVALDSLPGQVQHWDYTVELHLVADVEITRAKVLKACGLGNRSRLEFLVRARSDSTGISLTVARNDVPKKGPRRVPLFLDLPGRELGGRLTLETLLIVTNPEQISKVAASEEGSVLWSHTQRSQLEGTGSQFPTDAADFRAIGRPNPDAAWELQVDMSDPDARFMSAVRLTLNTAHPAIVRLLEGADDDATRQLTRTLHWDVTRQLVNHALDCEESMSADFDAEAKTLSGVLRNILGLVWPTVSTMTIRSWRDQEPTRIETHLQQHCRLVP